MDQKIKREQVIRDAKSSIILDAARKVFSERGFHETRLEDIAMEAGFSKASLYNYYNDKLEIFYLLAIREFDELLVRVKAQFDPDRYILRNLEMLLRTVFSFFGVHFAFIVTTTNFRLMCAHKQELEEPIHKEMYLQFKSKFSELSKVHLDIIENGRSRREIETSLSNEAIVSYISSLIRGVVFEWTIKGVIGDIENEIATLLVFLKSGLECSSISQ